MAHAREIDLDTKTLADPYPMYASLRETPGLVRHARERYFLVSRYDDIREAAMRTEDFSSRIVEVLVASTGLPIFARRGVVRFGPVDVLAVEDAPRHPFQRKLTTKHFARDPVARAIERVSLEIGRRLDAFVAQGGGDFMASVAGPIPVAVALSILGLPDRDGARVKVLSDRAVSLLAGVLPREARGELVLSGLELYAYSFARFVQHRAHGTGEPLFDAIAASTREGALGVREAASIVMQVLIAGSDSTASLLGSAVRILAESPELARGLREEPRLVSAFIEEVLRLESPFQGHFRVVRHGTTLAGQRLYEGDRLMLLWASGNRDPKVYERPDALDLLRKRERPHLGFGQGIHLCLGAGLARGVARVVIEGLLARTTDIALGSGSLRYKPSGFVRTLDGLPIRVVAG